MADECNDVIGGMTDSVCIGRSMIDPTPGSVGLFAIKAIPRGKFICFYEGKMLSKDMDNDNDTPQDLLFKLDHYKYLNSFFSDDELYTLWGYRYDDEVPIGYKYGSLINDGSFDGLADDPLDKYLHLTKKEIEEKNNAYGIVMTPERRPMIGKKSKVCDPRKPLLPRVAIISRRDITPGEEILHHYGYQYWVGLLKLITSVAGESAIVGKFPTEDEFNIFDRLLGIKVVNAIASRMPGKKYCLTPDAEHPDQPEDQITPV